MTTEQMMLDTSRPDYSRLDDYFGLWSIYEPAFNGLFDLVARTDLSQHIAVSKDELAELLSKRGVGESSVAAPYRITPDGVAVIPISGSLMKMQSSLSSSTSTVEARQMVRHAKSDPNVKAVCFVFDTPGGTVSGTQQLAADIAALGRVKPTAGYCDDMCASAGYWLASQCQTIACGPTALVGSIGTFMAVSDLSAQAADMKVKVHVIKAGEFKGAGVAGTVVTEEQLAEWQRMVNSLNEQFVAEALVSGRKMAAGQAAKLADGRVHVGAEALALGLVDAVQGLDETISQLVERAGSGKASSSKKDTQMSIETTAPKAATLAELKAACSGAVSDFLMAQLEAGVTVDVARSNWVVAMQQTLASKEAELKAAKDEAAEAKLLADAAAKKRGVEPFSEGKPGGQAAEFEGDAVSEFNKRRDALIAGGSSPFQASAQIAKSDPKLHIAYQLATNSKKNAKALVRDLAETYDIAG